MSDYEQQKRTAAERSRQKSLLGRDISPLPPIADVARRRRCRDDLVSFCREYFAVKCSKPFGRHHLTYLESLKIRILQGGRQAIGMPRGSGKTTLAYIAAVWALIYGHKRFLILLAANTKEARKILGAIRSILSNNPILAGDFPEVSYAMNKLRGSALLARGQLYYGEPTLISLGADSITLPTIRESKASGSTCISLGINAAIRGQSAELQSGQTIRPDFIILDDLQTDKVAANPNRVSALEDLIASTVGGLGESGTEISQLMICTVISPDDLADRFLDLEIHPRWNGLRFAMIDPMPERMDLWREYRSLRFSDTEMADSFYRAHRKEMDAGAVATWEEDHPADKTAIQYAMDLWADNEKAFWSERQNKPLTPAGSRILVPARTIMKKVNGHPRGTVPEQVVAVTGFCDVHDDLLYFAMVGWDQAMTGYICDYGTFPEQSRRYFSKSDHGLESLRGMFAGTSADGALLKGLTLTLADLAARQYRQGTGWLPVARVFVDSKYKPDIVEQAIRSSGAKNVIPSRGAGVKATDRPMSEWPKRPGRVFGFHWIDEKIEKRDLRSVLIDTNYYKSRTHEAFSLEPGEKGSLSFYGSDQSCHRMIAEHCCAESVHLVSSGTNEVNEWKPKPTALDNHFFDCLTGNIAAASTLGLTQQI